MIAMLHFAVLAITTMFAAATAAAFHWLLLQAAFSMMRPATARRIPARPDGRTRCGGGGAGSPPFPAGALAAGAATDSGGRPGAVDHGKLCGDSGRSCGSTRQRDLGRAPRYVVSRRAFGDAAGGFRRDLRYTRAGVLDAGGRKSKAKG